MEAFAGRLRFEMSQVRASSRLETYVNDLVDAIPRDGSIVKLGDLFLRYTADVTTNFMVSVSIQSFSQSSYFEGDLIEGFREAHLGEERSFRPGRFARYVPRPGFHRPVEKVHASIALHVVKVVKTHQSKRRSKKGIAQSDKKDQLLDELLKVTGVTNSP